MNECPRCGRLESHTEICALQGEIERLLHDIERHIAMASELATENDRLRAELAEAKRDAERYRWLRRPRIGWDVLHQKDEDSRWMDLCGQNLDAEIDAAMAGGAK